MSDVKKSDDKKPKYDKPVVIDLGESPKGQGGDGCTNGSANANGCGSGGSGKVF